MKYMLFIYGDEAMAAAATPEQLKDQEDAYEAFTKSIIASGNFLDGDPFLPTASASSVAVRDGKTVRGQGPVAPTTPQLQAYYKVQAGSEDEAAEMASRIPGALYGTIEVRRVMEFD